MLEVCQLKRCYGDFVAVDDVSFSIGKGEIVGLLGHNGAGKTTIMKMLSGFLEPDNGRVTLDGIDLAEKPKAVQSMLGYLPESLPVYPEMTVADYLDYAADLKGLSGDTKRQEIQRAIQATKLTEKLLAPIATLSRGYKQRVGVAQSILGRPKLLILDEPTNGLDPEQTQQMRQLIRDIAKDATVILSTHIMQEVEALCHRVLILGAGKLSVDENLDTLKNSHRCLLHSSIAPENVSVLESLNGVKNLQLIAQVSENEFEYAIEFAPDAEQKTIQAQIVKRIVEQDKEVFAITPEHRSLEALFNQVSQQTATKGGLKNAA
jgi:ABC-2 type transport system ATP-binding protein